jgi:hypothetical protein
MLFSNSRHCEERQRRSNPASAQAALDCFADARNDANIKSPSRRIRTPSPRVRGEGRDEGALPLGRASRPKSATPLRQSLRLESRRGPSPSVASLPRPLPARRGEVNTARRHKQNRSRGASIRPSFVHHDNAKIDSPLNKRGKRSAERRMPSMSADRRQVNAKFASLICYAAARPFGARPPFGAHACGTRHRLSPRWLSPRTGFPANEPRRCFARLALLSAVKHAPCRPVFLPVDRGPRAARERMAYPRAGTAPRFRLSGLPFRKGALNERGDLRRNCISDDHQELSHSQ